LNLNMVEMQGSMLQLIQQMNTLPDTLQSWLSVNQHAILNK
jgi:hypothetical protein